MLPDWFPPLDSTPRDKSLQSQSKCFKQVDRHWKSHPKHGKRWQCWLINRDTCKGWSHTSFSYFKLQWYSRTGNTVLFLEEEQLHGEMKELSQRKKNLARNRKSIHRLPSPSPKRSVGETEEGEVEKGGLFLMSSF